MIATILRRWAGWLLLAIVLVVVARGVDWRGVLAAAAVGRPLWLLAAMAANASILALGAAQWLLFLPAGGRIPAAEMFHIVALTSSISNGGPVLAGHAAGIRLLATRGKLGHAVGLSVTILDQLAEGLAKLALIATAMLVVPAFDLRLVGAALLIAVPALAVAFTLLAHRRSLLDGLAARTTGGTARAAGFLARAVRQLDALRRPGRFGAGVLLALAQKAAEGLAIAAVAVALGVALPGWAVVAAVLAVSLSGVVAVTPGNVGGYEGSAFLVYQAAGVEPDSTLALALVQHAAYLIPLAGTGWLLESRRLWRGVEAAPRDTAEDRSGA